MTETARLNLPLVQANQAQKHVTVNEALMRLDGVTQLSLESRVTVSPPLLGVDGESYWVPGGATDAWSGQDGLIAIWSNGGWAYVVPQVGWRAWLKDETRMLVWDGSTWRVPSVTVGASGAAIHARTAEYEHVVLSGSDHTTSFSVPAGSMVLAISARVLDEITGTLTAWQLGNPGAPDRFGSGLGTAAGSYAQGWLGQPTTYYSAEPLQLTPIAGTFTGGRILVAMHFLALDLPS